MGGGGAPGDQDSRAAALTPTESGQTHMEAPGSQRVQALPELMGGGP